MELTWPVSTLPWRRRLTWLALAAILCAFVIAVIRLHPTDFFGYTEDDSIYFSSAKALAEGKGYVLPSFPGTPAASKYPVFYPWILSWVWRLNPSFPRNLAYAIAISVAFGLLYLTLAFLFLRRLHGIGDREALLLTAFCALHPLVIFYSGSILSDIPFASLALAALLLADMALKRREAAALAAGAGLLAGLGMLTRVFGIPIAMGILLCFALRRAWRAALIFSVSAAPFAAALAWRMIFAPVSAPPVSGPAASGVAWVHTWTYYTSYLDAWKVADPNPSVFLAMLRNNALVLLRAPADYFVSPSPAADTRLGWILAILVTVVLMKGVLRGARSDGFRPVHVALPFYAGLTLLWNYPQGVRFLIPFLPLFAAGIWLEGKYIVGMVRAEFAGARFVAEKVLAVAFGGVAMAFLCGVALNYAHGTRIAAGDQSNERASLLQEKREAYSWLSSSAPPGARVAAYEDATAYLYTGRTTVRPFTFTTEEFYEPARLREDLMHMADVPRAVGAEYWVVSDDDYDLEWPEVYARGHARIKELEGVLPVVYSSPRGRVRIHSLACLDRPDAPSCASARNVLFPADNGRLFGASLR